MKVRQKILLNVIILKKTININELANDFAVSTRTIRNDYKIIKDYLDELLNKNSLELYNNNISLLLNDNEMAKIRKSLNSGDYYLYKLSSSEREMITLSELIYNNDYVTIDALAEKMYVSRGTIIKDLIKVKEWCNRNSVQVLSKKANGLKINVNEKKRRSIIAKLIRDSNELNKSESLSNEINICRKFFKNVDLLKVKDLVMDAENKYEIVLSDIDFEALTIHIALSIERSLENINVNLDNDFIKIEKNSIEYQMSTYIVSQINNIFHVKMPENEIYFIALHILGKVNLENIEEYNEKWLDLQITTIKLIREVSEYIGYDLEGDIKLYDGLYNHLSAAILRLKNNGEIQNPFKEQMLHDYPDIYDALHDILDELQNFNKITFSDDEKAYIILHFAASIERNKYKIKERMPRVIIVCSTGIGTARIVESRVMQYFKLNIVKVVALHQLRTSLMYESVDFIISTVPINAEIPVIQVSPIITELEIKKINDLLIGLGFNNYINETSSVYTGNNLAVQVKKLLEICSSEKDLKNSLEQLLKINEGNMVLQFDKSDRKGSRVLMLSDTLREEYICLEDNSITWEEAIEHAGERLLNNNVITSEYIKTTIKNVKETGPYIVITKGVAIPHASNELGVNKTAISLLRLNKGINFGNEQNDPVKYVFMLATTSPSSHLKALSELVTLLSKEDFYKVIDSAISPKEVVDYIKKFEKKDKGEGV